MEAHTWTWPLVLRVPDSSSGRWLVTHLPSTYKRACTLSSAFTTTSSAVCNKQTNNHILEIPPPSAPGQLIKARTLEETISVEVLGLLAHLVEVGVDLEGRVHGDGRAGRAGGLGPLDVLGPEQELAVEVALLDQVVVGHGDQTIPRAHAQHGEVLQHLAANSASPDLLLLLLLLLLVFLIIIIFLLLVIIHYLYNIIKIVICK
jgi:hypothetical protein